MSELTLDFIQPDVVLEFPAQQEVVLSFPTSTPGPPGSIDLASVLALLSDLDEYESDEKAEEGGVAYKGWYIASDGHNSVKPGTLTQNRIE